MVFNTIDSNCERIANAIMEHLANTSDDNGSMSISVGRDAVEEALFHNTEYIDGINKYLQNCKAIQIRFDSSDLKNVIIKYERNKKTTRELRLYGYRYLIITCSTLSVITQLSFWKM